MTTETTEVPDTFRWPVRVYYEDTDAGGVVYHASYLRYMERARTEWLRALGHEQDVVRREEGVLFAVSRVQLDFLRPASFNEKLWVSVKIRRVGRASLTVAQDVVSQAGQVLCQAEVRIACVEAETFRPRPIPARIARGLHP